MLYDDEIDFASGLAEKAFVRLKQEALPPSPSNFEVWYVYYAKTNAELKAEIDELKKEAGEITTADCRTLYEKYLSDTRNQEMVAKAGDEIQSTLQDVSGLMDNMRSATSEYSGTLEGVSEKISNAETPEDLKDIMDGVAEDTAKMVKQNKKLEEQLDKSSVAMEELQKDLDRVRKEAMTDGLTGLSNRKSFDEQIESMVQKCNDEGEILTLLMLDIDHFKAFNDNYGHQVGDQVLRLVSHTLTDGVKGKDVAARYGGEEFVIILPNTNMNAGIAVGDNLRKAMANKEVINRSSGENLGRITMSVGVAQYYAGESVEGLIERADAALYTAKHNGRNQVAAAPTPHEISQEKEAS